MIGSGCAYLCQRVKRASTSEIEAATSGGGWSTVGNTTPAAGALRIAGAAGLVGAARVPRPAAQQPLPLTIRLDVVARRPWGSVHGSIAATPAERTAVSTRTSHIGAAHTLIGIEAALIDTAGI